MPDSLHKLLQNTWVRGAGSAIVFLAVLLLASEIALRVTSYEKDSRIYLYGTYPVAVSPTKEIWEERFERLAVVEAQQVHYSTYDSLLGWAYRPNYTSADSLYIFDEHGMRAHPHSLPDCQVKGDSCLHILLSGNSYMMSAEVNGQESLAYFLEKEFWDRGIPCHVYNGAAGNYSLDQAYLQWKFKGRQFKPDIVLLGVNPRHFSGNASLFPYNEFPETNIYYSKPIATLQGDSLEWINLPTVPMEEVLDKMVFNFEQSPFYQYRYQQKMERIRKQPVYSYFLSTLSRYTISREKPSVQQKAQMKAVSYKLLESFKQGVEAQGGKMLLLQTPVFEDVLGLYTGIDYFLKYPRPYEVEEILPIVYTEDVFQAFPTINQGFTAGMSHYSANANRQIAQKVARKLLSN